jgi:hypothetical protein
MTRSVLPSRTLLLLLLVSVSGAFAQPGSPSPDLPDLTIELTDTTVHLTGVTPGGWIGLVETSRRVVGVGPTVTYGTVLLWDDDEDGAVVHEVEGGVPPACWC